jgi:hypothetical protein
MTCERPIQFSGGRQTERRNATAAPLKVKKLNVTVSWYYGLISVTLKLHRTEWRKILQGIPLRKDGRGYMSEEGFCHDYWLFNFERPGSLEVDYDDGGQGFVGDLEDALIEIE